ncbi:hypothetical protein CCH79_00018196 [Gambusia affinis]|uniref:CCHC-type domain-containing protein n=1 Tax=Gambusia affinis TaxID=33528 RepID=A0A315VGJ6_GAMAF|nr:hypothetical protein CCH79_00018196 [Gambusia affinis]
MRRGGSAEPGASGSVACWNLMRSSARCSAVWLIAWRRTTRLDSFLKSEDWALRTDTIDFFGTREVDGGVSRNTERDIVTFGGSSDDRSSSGSSSDGTDSPESPMFAFWRAVKGKCLGSFGRLKETRPQLANTEMTSLSQMEPKTITVLMFSEQVWMEDIRTWLQQRWTVKQGYGLKDEDGVRTGGRRFFIQLKKNLATGKNCTRPIICHRCGSQQLLSVECRSKYGHLTKDCQDPVNCNLCGERGHIFKNCPKSYT